MDWSQVLFIVGSVGSIAWLMHRESSKEMKDFHGRLCSLEQKYINMMERFMEKK